MSRIPNPMTHSPTKLEPERNPKDLLTWIIPSINHNEEMMVVFWWKGQERLRKDRGGYTLTRASHTCPAISPYVQLHLIPPWQPPATWPHFILSSSSYLSFFFTSLLLLPSPLLFPLSPEKLKIILNSFFIYFILFFPHTNQTHIYQKKRER